MTTATPRDLRLRASTEELCGILVRIRALHGELLELLTEQEQALVEVRTDELGDIREREEGIIRRIIDEEKERLLLTEELGDLLDHDQPATIRVAEILPHLPDTLAARLSGERDELRQSALRLARQNALNRALIEHSIGHIQIFMSKVAREEAGGPRYDERGSTQAGGGDAFLFDRRV